VELFLANPKGQGLVNKTDEVSWQFETLLIVK
jgi:hypothetical protein